MPFLANPTYFPASSIITAITRANPAAVTTAANHDFIDGLIVRLWVPDGFGMTQANQLYGEIAVTGNTTFTIDIDTTTFDTFAIPIVFPQSEQEAFAVCIGEVSEILTGAVRNIL